MIPYFQFISFNLGPLEIQVWGLFVALGILIGAWISAGYAKKNGLDKDVVYSAAFWVIIGAFLGARMMHVLAYEPVYYLANLIEILQFWKGGLSVSGGFLGALVGYLLYMRSQSLSWLKYADKVIYGLPLGLGVGRIGCFLIHDHPGTQTDFFLGIVQPGGGAIHDHGLYLSINGFILAIVFYFLAKKNRPDGFLLRFFMIWYGVVRFFLDFFRVIDSTYFYLTPAQYFSLMMIAAAGIWIIINSKKSKLQQPSV